ncbi:hypothetical protein IHQ68_10015 [Chelatococcus sambhunathii]|uniref:Uncharacterized protein n=1 Tax=Chelatococcus sambhunathii TaxID=363953 RepID=A0ABU1DFP3_9HYPH|nr:hypothetical protein [Chelatococcus sambhunathii]MDR4306953.1 hypothetical protein [Chelatococcus sambhunathii]
MKALIQMVLPVLLVSCGAAVAQTPSPPPPAEQPAAAERQPSPGDKIGVPARVWAVRIAGGWEADGRKGFSRVIGAFEGDKQKLTVQWLAEPDGQVIDAVELDDEEAAKLTFGDIRAEPEDKGGITVFLDTVPDNDGLRDTWVLVIGGPGDVRFGPATN